MGRMYPENPFKNAKAGGSERVNHISKHQEESWKNTTQQSIFDELWSLWKFDQTLSFFKLDELFMSLRSLFFMVKMASWSIPPFISTNRYVHVLRLIES